MGSVIRPMSDEDRGRIAARYPRRKPVDILVAVVAVAALVAAISVVVVAGVQRSNPPVAAMVRQFDVTSPQEIAVTIVVQRTDPGQAATCSLFAQAVSYEYVGELDVEVPPGTETLTTVSLTMKTLKQATSVSVERCLING
ncbi:DUF4307 domain-containing protein [Tessaracoccus antarcticus]|uniref:DUF4307 domain-containing protein n=1 Tax=Tessaracoccus antarcticus TaxID=2479848 RepID=A0A3M0GKR2_9ACTN|nr:DUF4307 domain-containing protein [Tessaracoccus antarcticus]